MLHVKVCNFKTIPTLKRRQRMKQEVGFQRERSSKIDCNLSAGHYHGSLLVTQFCSAADKAINNAQPQNLFLRLYLRAWGSASTSKEPVCIDTGIACEYYTEFGISGIILGLV